MRHYYISSGAFNAMYTLRVRVLVQHEYGSYESDDYCRNLSRNRNEAERKAIEYVKRANRADCEPVAVFDGFEVDELNDYTKGGAQYTYNLQNSIDNYCSSICHGNWPFTKYRGPLKDVPNRHLLSCFEFFGKEKNDFLNPISVLMAEVLNEQLTKAIEERYQLEKEERSRNAIDVPITTDRVKVAGRIISFKEVESIYGSTTKMLVDIDGGFRLFGSVPSSLHAEIDVGSRIEFTAKLERSKKDPKFGFFSRPTKARKLETA